MRIGRPEIYRNGKDVRYRVQVERADGSGSELYYSLAKSSADLLTDSADAALVALLIPAMAKGEDIHIAGSVSERLYYNLSGRCQKLFQTVIPSLQRIEIHPEKLCTGGRRASGVATGFSGGIDSNYVLADHFFGKAPKRFRITHLL